MIDVIFNNEIINLLRDKQTKEYKLIRSILFADGNCFIVPESTISHAERNILYFWEPLLVELIDRQSIKKSDLDTQDCIRILNSYKQKFDFQVILAETSQANNFVCSITNPTKDDKIFHTILCSNNKQLAIHNSEFKSDTEIIDLFDKLFTRQTKKADRLIIASRYMKLDNLFINIIKKHFQKKQYWGSFSNIATSFNKQVKQKLGNQILVYNCHPSILHERLIISNYLMITVDADFDAVNIADKTWSIMLYFDKDIVSKTIASKSSKVKIYPY